MLICSLSVHLFYRLLCPIQDTSIAIMILIPVDDILVQNMSPSNKPLVWPGGGYLLSFPLLIQKANSLSAYVTAAAPL